MGRFQNDRFFCENETIVFENDRLTNQKTIVKRSFSKTINNPMYTWDFKGTVSVILSDPLHANTPMLDITIDTLIWSSIIIPIDFFIVAILHKWTHNLKKKFKNYKHCYIIYIRSAEAFKGIVVNRTLPSFLFFMWTRMLEFRGIVTI